MPSRTLPGLGLNSDWSLGENGWKEGMDANLLALSTLVNLAVADRVSSLPVDAANGARYIVTAGVNTNKIALRDKGAWVFFTPLEGWTAYVNSTDNPVYFDGATWVDRWAALDDVLENVNTAVTAAQEAAEAAIEAVENANEAIIPDDSVTFAKLNSDVFGAIARTVASRAELKALDPAKFKRVFLTTSGREGTFVWRVGNFTTQVAEDTMEGIYIKATNTAASVGAWVRTYPGGINAGAFLNAHRFPGNLYANWFGALGDFSTNNGPILGALPKPNNALLAERESYRLAPGPYYVSSNTTIDVDITFEPGAIMILAANVNVVFNGRVSALDTQQIFVYPGSSHVYLGVRNQRVPVEWYYVPDDDGTQPINHFLNDQMELWPSDGREFILPQGKRRLDAVWNIRDRNFCSIRGSGGNLRSNVDVNVDPKWPGGGSALVLGPNVDYAIYVPASGVPGKRISGLVLDGFSILGNNNRVVGQGGIFINNDSDGVILRNLVIISCGGQFGVLVFGADAMVIDGCWIAEGTRSIKVENSIELRIINCNLGAQPTGITLDLVNADRFVIASNNIFPDGSTNINLFNCHLGEVYGNYMHSQFTGVLQITNSFGIHVHGNTLRVPWGVVTSFPVTADPLGRDTQFGLLRVVGSDDCLIANNQIWNFMPVNAAVIRHVSGNRCEYIGGHIKGNGSNSKFVQDGGSDVKIIDVCQAGEHTLNGGTRGLRDKP